MSNRVFKIKHYGKDYHVAVNINTSISFAKMCNIPTVGSLVKEMQGFDQEDTPIDVLEKFGILYLCALKEGARIVKQEFDESLEDVLLMIQENREGLNKTFQMLVDKEVGKNPQKPRSTPVRKK